MDNFFIPETEIVLTGWDNRIYMRSVKDKLDWMELTAPLPCGDGFIPKGYQWNGASSGIARYTLIFNFPKWRHPIATCRHDWRCEHARNKKEREKADHLFRNDIGKGQSNKVRGWWEQTKGFVGVRIGAFFHKYK